MFPLSVLYLYLCFTHKKRKPFFYISTNHFLPFWGDAVAMETVYNDRYHINFDAIIKVSFFQTKEYKNLLHDSGSKFSFLIL